MDNKYYELKDLYVDIHTCHMCIGMDKEKVLRNIDAISPYTDVLVISEALAENQLRKTGVNYFNLNGQLDGTGKKFEKYLNQFSRTLYPYKNVTLIYGKVIPKASEIFIPIYNTEAAQCFPGKKTVIRKGRCIDSIRAPSSGEINNCMNKKFLENEIKFINPKLIFLQGKKGRDTFYKYYLNEEHPAKLEDHIMKIINDNKLPEFELFGNKVFVCPIIHASGSANGSWPIMETPGFINIIRQALL